AAVTELERLDGRIASAVLLGEPVGELLHLLLDVFGIPIHVALRRLGGGLRQSTERQSIGKLLRTISLADARTSPSHDRQDELSAAIAALTLRVQATMIDYS